MGIYPFAIIFIICVVCFYYSETCNSAMIKRRVEIYVVIILALFSGLRYEVGGADYFAYLTIFEQCPDLSVFIRDFNYIDEYFLISYERGYLLLNSIFKTVGLNYQGLVLFHSLFFFICLYVGLRKYCDCLLLVIFVFLYKMYFWDVFVLLRQSMAVGLFLCSMHLIEEKKPFRYFLMILISITFHRSALILFPLYFLSYIKMKRNYILYANFVFGPTLLLVLIGVDFFSYLAPILEPLLGEHGMYDNKMGRIVTGAYGGENRVNFLNYIEYMVLSVLVFVHYDTIVKHRSGQFVLKLFLMLVPIFTIFSGNEVVGRFREYFILSYGLILVYLSANLLRYKWILYFATILVCFLGYMRFLVRFDNGTINYRTILLENVSIFE